MFAFGIQQFRRALLTNNLLAKQFHAATWHQPSVSCGIGFKLLALSGFLRKVSGANRRCPSLSRTNEQKTAILCTLASTRRCAVSFGPAPLVNRQGELAPAAPSGSRSSLCALDNRYAERRLLAEDARRCTAVRALIWFAGVLDGLDRPVMTSLNRLTQAFFRFIK